LLQEEEKQQPLERNGHYRSRGLRAQNNCSGTDHNNNNNINYATTNANPAVPKEFHPPTAFSGRTGGNNEETKENNNCNGNCSDRASDFHATTSTTTTTTQREGTKRIIDV
jgi:hypothetical protein